MGRGMRGRSRWVARTVGHTCDVVWSHKQRRTCVDTHKQQAKTKTRDRENPTQRIDTNERFGSTGDVEPTNENNDDT